MRLVTTLCLLALAAPAAAQHSAPPATSPGADGVAHAHGTAQPDGVAHIRVTARIIVVDRDALTRAGLAYVVLGNDRVRVLSTARSSRGWGSGSAGSRGARIGVGTHGVTAFLDAVRDSRWVRSESTQQVLTISGGEGVVSSTSLAVGRHASRTRGPSLVVSPTVLQDGSVHLRVSARHEDSVTYAWGYGVDGSPAAVDAEVIARDGDEVILASSSAVQTSRESGLLRWSEAEHGRDVLVAVSAQVVHH